jgi:hypothetical protein
MGDVLVFVHFTFFRLEWCLKTVGVRGKVQRGISEMPSLQLKSTLAIHIVNRGKIVLERSIAPRYPNASFKS